MAQNSIFMTENTVFVNQMTQNTKFYKFTNFTVTVEIFLTFTLGEHEPKVSSRWENIRQNVEPYIMHFGAVITNNSSPVLFCRFLLLRFSGLCGTLVLPTSPTPRTSAPPPIKSSPTSLGSPTSPPPGLAQGCAGLKIPLG